MITAAFPQWLHLVTLCYLCNLFSQLISVSALISSSPCMRYGKNTFLSFWKKLGACSQSFNEYLSPIEIHRCLLFTFINSWAYTLHIFKLQTCMSLFGHLFLLVGDIYCAFYSWPSFWNKLTIFRGKKLAQNLLIADLHGAILSGNSCSKFRFLLICVSTKILWNF